MPTLSVRQSTAFQRDVRLLLIVDWPVLTGPIRCSFQKRRLLSTRLTILSESDITKSDYDHHPQAPGLWHSVLSRLSPPIPVDHCRRWDHGAVAGSIPTDCFCPDWGEHTCPHDI
jgi:hypothetical protein